MKCYLTNKRIMKNYVAIAPEGKYLDITQGKEYPIANISWNEEFVYGRHFEMLDDIKDKICCNEFECAHLNGKNWTIKEVK